MASIKKLSRITGIFNRALTPSIVEVLNSIGIFNLQIANARTLKLKEKKSRFGIGSEMALIEDPADIISFLIPPKQEQVALFPLTDIGGLSTPGRAVIYSETVQLLKAHELCQENSVKSELREKQSGSRAELTGICCIVQRGKGNEVARVALDTGTCVPGISYGHGTGVRDKLGLLRITIPAEKEVINLVASSHDAEAVMDMMIDVGKLDQPGKGFIYLHPIADGIANMKVTLGMPKNAASMEQIIAAMDKLRGDTSWRSRTTSDDAGNTKHKRNYLNKLTNLIFTCNDGRGEDLVKGAMNVGAAGATIVKVRHHCLSDSEQSAISPAREECNMIVGEDQISKIMEAIEKEGGFDDNTHGQFLIHPILKACTYLGT